MVSLQAEQIERIDSNMDETLHHVDQGHSQLVKVSIRLSSPFDPFSYQELISLACCCRPQAPKCLVSSTVWCLVLPIGIVLWSHAPPRSSLLSAVLSHHDWQQSLDGQDFCRPDGFNGLFHHLWHLRSLLRIRPPGPVLCQNIKLFLSFFVDFRIACTGTYRLQRIPRHILIRPPGPVLTAR